MNQFQILDSTGNPVPISVLDTEAATLWGKEVDKKNYATPRTGGNWFDTIGWEITNPHSNWTSGWNNVKSGLFNMLMNGAYVHLDSMDEMNKIIADHKEWLTPYYQLIDLWESKGYTPKQITE